MIDFPRHDRGLNGRLSAGATDWERDDSGRGVAPPTVPDEPRFDVHDEETTLSVVEGVVYAMIDEHDYVVLPGDRITIPAGGPHRIWNAGDDVVRLIAERRSR